MRRKHSEHHHHHDGGNGSDGGGNSRNPSRARTTMGNGGAGAHFLSKVRFNAVVKSKKREEHKYRASNVC